MTELEAHIAATPLMDTHEHMRSEAEYTEKKPDILQVLFDGYTSHDLATAGADGPSIKHLLDGSDHDIAGRFRGVQAAWEAMQFTGYGEGVRRAAHLLYGIEEITPETLAGAAEAHNALLKPGERLRLLRDVAHLNHIQIDSFDWRSRPDPDESDFFLYDISWVGFSNGNVHPEAIHKATGIEVRNLETLRAAMAAIFASEGPAAVAVKTQHAYSRTLLWHERDDADVAPVLERSLAGDELTEDERLCLGDWCLARGVELAAQHNLPVKIHTGHYAGNGGMHMERISPSLLGGLLRRYPATRFVLMHIGYPYSDELVSLAKHFPNVWVDMCWAWSIDPYGSADFLRRFLHAVPANKLFVFGGDSFWPMIVVGYAAQTRAWLGRTLAAEIAAGDLTERQAITLATRLMRGNQEACFDLAGTRAARLGVE